MKVKYLFFFALINIKKGCIRVISTLLVMILLLFILMSIWIIADNKFINDENIIEKKYSQQGLYFDVSNVEDLNSTIEILKQNKIPFHISTFSKEYDFIVSIEHKVGLAIYSYDEFEKSLVTQIDGNGRDSIYISSALLDALEIINYTVGDTIKCELFDPIEHNSLFVNHQIVGVFESNSIEAYIDVRYLIEKKVLNQAQIIISKAEEISYVNIRKQYDKLSRYIKKDYINLNSAIKTHSLYKTITIIVCVVLSFLFIFATFSVITTSIFLTSFEKTGTYRILKLHGLKNSSLYIINLIETFIINLVATILTTILCLVCFKFITQIFNNIFEIEATSLKFNYIIPLIVYALIELYTVCISFAYVKKYSSKLGIIIAGGENE